MAEEETRLRVALKEAEKRVVAAESRPAAIEAELERVIEWRNWALLAVFAIAATAVIVLDSVAFDAVEGPRTG